MSKSLYLECGSGISGDMTVAALLDLGADQEVLEKALASLQLPGYKTAVTRVKNRGWMPATSMSFWMRSMRTTIMIWRICMGIWRKCMRMERSMYTIMSICTIMSMYTSTSIRTIMSMYMTRNIHTAMTRNTQESIITIMSTAACRRFLPLSAAVI